MGHAEHVLGDVGFAGGQPRTELQPSDEVVPVLPGLPQQHAIFLGSGSRVLGVDEGLALQPHKHKIDHLLLLIVDGFLPHGQLLFFLFVVIGDLGNCLLLQQTEKFIVLFAEQLPPLYLCVYPLELLTDFIDMLADGDLHHGLEQRVLEALVIDALTLQLCKDVGIDGLEVVEIGGVLDFLKQLPNELQDLLLQVGQPH
jgi:hypothetical protein